ncbi:MAG: TonB family protein [Paludibacteraceae bacterium]|nr:TonB family protein [Paludibacteraceae bacterium]
MRIKKSPQADLNNKRSMFTLIGLVIVLGLAYICFEWSKSTMEDYNPNSIVQEVAAEDELVDATTQDDQPEPEPEPEPEQETPDPDPQELKVVDDTVKTTAAVKEINESQNKPMEMPKTFDKDDDEGDDEVPFVKVEKKAQFPGGPDKLKEYLSKNLSYPQIAIDEGIEGKVFVKFVVSSKGTIKDAKVIRSVDPALDQEALRVVNAMPAWTPAEQHNKPCASYFTLPVNFVLSKN